MRINVSLKEFQEVIKKSNKLLSNCPKLPVIETLCIETSNQIITAKVTNLLESIIFNIDGAVEESGTTIIPKDIMKFVSKIKGVNRITITDGLIYAGNKEIKFVPEFTIHDYPEINNDFDNLLFATTEKQLSDMLTVKYAAAGADDEDRPSFMSVYLDKDNILATDRYRISKRKHNLNINIDNYILMPINAINNLSSFLSNKDGVVECFISDNQVGFKFGNLFHFFRLHECKTYPNIYNVYPEWKIEMEVSRKEFLNELEFIKNVGKVIKLRTEDGSIFINVTDTNNNSITSKIEGETITNGIERENTLLNSRFLHDALKNYGGDVIPIRFQSESCYSAMELGNDFILPIR
ncbi:MAG: hypothetical protein WC260_04230 [Candidatus Pacearchaeota archaeon]